MCTAHNAQPIMRARSARSCCANGSEAVARSAAAAGRDGGAGAHRDQGGVAGAPPPPRGAARGRRGGRRNAAPFPAAAVVAARCPFPRRAPRDARAIGAVRRAGGWTRARVPPREAPGGRRRRPARGERRDCTRARALNLCPGGRPRGAASCAFHAPPHPLNARSDPCAPIGARPPRQNPRAAACGGRQQPRCQTALGPAHRRAPRAVCRISFRARRRARHRRGVSSAAGRSIGCIALLACVRGRCQDGAAKDPC